MKRYIFILLLMVSFGAGCDKDDPLPPSAPAVDDVPPTVEITLPQEGYVYAQGSIINIKASADDNTAVERVDFYRDGVFMISDPSQPYETYWSTNKTTDTGLHVLSARAYDRSDNDTESDDVTIRITP